MRDDRAVTAPQSESPGLLIVKARRLAGTRPRLLATVTATLDLTGREETQATVSSVAEVLALVERWLEEFSAPSGRLHPEGPS